MNADAACTACGQPVERETYCAWHDADGRLHIACACPGCGDGPLFRAAHRHGPDTACYCASACRKNLPPDREVG